MENSLFINKALQNDNVYVKSEIVSLSELTNMPSRRGLENAIISEGEIVNVVSKSYGHLPNEKFFAEVEAKLIHADVNYKTRSINRENRSFAVDYILDDENYIVKVKNGKDQIVPMLRFVNSYDSSHPTTGHFGFFRQVCSNGLHVAHSDIGFKVRHSGSIQEIVLPEIKTLINKFFDNEYYSLSRKFEVLAETAIPNLDTFIEYVATNSKLFKYESTENKQPVPSINAKLVKETILKEASVLDVRPNLWLGYNAFNEVLHTKYTKGFDVSKKLDGAIFETILEMA